MFNNYMEVVTIIIMYCRNVVKIPLFQGKRIRLCWDNLPSRQAEPFTSEDEQAFTSEISGISFHSAGEVRMMSGRERQGSGGRFQKPVHPA